MYFAIVCWDRPGVGELREQTRHRHLQYLKEHAGKIHLGGPFENAEGGIVGTLFIINVANLEQARAFIDDEPFHNAGVFESVRVRRWRQMQPEIVRGANEITDQEAQLQLREEGV